MPRESTFSAREMPGEMVNMVISGYFPWSTPGSMEYMMPNLAKAAIIVHDSRIFGHRLENTMRTVASRETSTAASGFSEKYVSIQLTAYSLINTVSIEELQPSLESGSQ